MTFTQLDKHVTKYLLYLKNTRALKNIDDIKHRVTYSKKSRSFYVKLILVINSTAYTKTIRFSDHPYVYHEVYPQKIKGIVLESDNLNKRDIKHVEALLRREIKKLQYCAHMSKVLSFKA